MPAIAPAMVGRGQNQYYKTDEEYVFAIAEALKTEYRAIVDAGFVLQIDDPGLGETWDMLDPGAAARGLPADAGAKPRGAQSRAGGHPRGPRAVSPLLGQLARPARPRPRTARHRRPHAPGQGAELFGRGGDTPALVRVACVEDVKLPEGKILIPGVIAHTTAVVEHPETIAERIMNFASSIGRERVIAGADCGFAQGALYQRQHPAVMWAKFEALVAGARLASERLWRRLAASQYGMSIRRSVAERMSF